MSDEIMNDANNIVSDDVEINIDLNAGANRLGNVEVIDQEPTQQPEILPPNQHQNPVRLANQGQAPANTNTPAATTNNLNNVNQFNNVRDRLFHAMLVRVALKYSSKVNITIRRIIEASILFTAFVLLFSLIFVHFKFTKSSTSCLDELKPEWFKHGYVRVEVVRNLKTLELKESFIKRYVKEKSDTSCRFRMEDVFLQGPRAIPREIRKLGWCGQIKTPLIEPTLPAQSYFRRIVNGVSRGLDVLYPAKTVEKSEEPLNEYETEFDDYDEDDENDSENRTERVSSSSIKDEANYAWKQEFRLKHSNLGKHEYIYRVEYAMLYGVLRLPPSYREKHDIPAALIRIDSASHCFGDTLTRMMMHLFVGYEDAIIAALRAHAHNMTAKGEATGLGYLHDLGSHEHYHFVSNHLGKMSYLTAAFLMLVFTFAISMLLRFSHHQIFIFIIDLLHMFELQQPLHFPVAPIFTVILALVGMEAIMSEVFNDTTTAFYVILIVWVADQYDAICCHSPISKKFWLRAFYIYQYLFYAYQYRFGGQYGTLALWTSATFILHSMIFFFHHYEMPLILYQDRVQQILADLHAPQNAMGTVEVQTITVAVHSRTPTQLVNLPNQGSSNEAQAENVVAEPLSPSSVFDARGPVLVPHEEPEPEVIVEEVEPTNPEEIVAHRLVNDAMNELFNAPAE